MTIEQVTFILAVIGAITGMSSFVAIFFHDLNHDRRPHP